MKELYCTLLQLWSAVALGACDLSRVGVISQFFHPCGTCGMRSITLVAQLLLLAQPASMLQLVSGHIPTTRAVSSCHFRRVALPVLCATPITEDEDEGESSTDGAPIAQEEPKPTRMEAVKNIFISEDGQPTEFGGQVALLTAAFVVFLGLSTTLLNDDFWLTPF